MCSVRFFPEINDAIQKINVLAVAIGKFKEKIGESKYQLINEALRKKRYGVEDDTDDEVDLLSDVIANCDFLVQYCNKIKNRFPIIAYAKPLHDTLQYLIEDVTLCQSVLHSEGKLKIGDNFEKEKKFCDELKKEIERIEADFTELEQATSQHDPIDVICEEEKQTAKNKI